MIKHKTARQIDRLIRARYPVIAVQSHEENRVIAHVQEIAQAQVPALIDAITAMAEGDETANVAP